MDARITPEGSLELLSRLEVSQLRDTGAGGLYELWRQCSLAILNSGAEDDDVREILRRNEGFNITIVQQERGVELELTNAPDTAFVDGRMIRGIREHLFSVLRDLVYIDNEILTSKHFDLTSSEGITDAVFHILRHARALNSHDEPKLVVCWGGHAISRKEYDYSKAVGYELGLRGVDICTGCGAGAMKGPMKGAGLGHAKQRISSARYLGITEPSIIAAESPNPIVSELVIMPDMEKRLEAFVRAAHCIVVFPGGVGTAEEILYLLGILLRPENAEVQLPLIFTGPASSKPYFDRLHDFIGETLGSDAQSRYQLVLASPQSVAREVVKGLKTVTEYRRDQDDAYFFNWLLTIEREFQEPFAATHESMSSLELHKNQSAASLAVNLRRAFSGIVGGNVRESGIKLVEAHGPFEIKGEPVITKALDALLTEFVTERRMRLSDPATYEPCYRIVG